MAHPSRVLVVLAVVGLVGTTAGCRDLRPNGGQTGGKSSTVVYTITGHGTADVRYAATATSALTRKAGMHLPWHATVTTKDHSRTVYQVEATGSSGQRLGCGIEVNGVRLTPSKSGGVGTVACSFIK